MSMEPMDNILRPEGRNEKGNVWKWLSYAAMFLVGFVVFDALARRGSSDLSIHATWAAEGDFLNPRTFLRHGAHPLWHVLVALTMLTGLPVKLAATLVTALLKLCELILIRRLMAAYLRQSVSANVITLAAFCCALVSSLCVPWINPTVYVGIGSPNPWHSPTQMTAMVAMLLCVPYTAHCYARFERLLPQYGKHTILPWKQPVTLGVLLLASLVAKPTFMQAFLPAAGIFFLIQWIRHKENSRFFLQIVAVVLPSVLLMVLQYLFYFSGVIVPSQGSVALELSWNKAGQVLLATLLIQAFPLYALLTCCRRQQWKDPFITLSALLDVAGVAEYLLFGETGRRALDGNFGWGMMGGALMLWVVMLICFMRSYAAYRAERTKSVNGDGARDAGSARKCKYAGGFVLLAWHLGSGIYYLVYLLTTSAPL